MEDRPTYKDMTIEQLGNGADLVDLALFRAACRCYQRQSGCNDEESTKYLLAGGDWRRKAQALLRFPSYEVARASVIL